MKITPQQEVFCQSVANGSNYSDAYREAYPRSKKWKDKSINENSSKLYAKVSPRIKEIQAEIANKNLWTREKSVSALKKIVESEEEFAKPNDIISAVKELNSMHGFNDPKKYEITNPDGSLKPTIIKIIAENE